MLKSPRPLLKSATAIVALFLGGCTFISDDGPQSNRIAGSATALSTTATSDTITDYALVDLTGQVISVIPAHGPSRLNSSFGLGKGAPPVTKIVIGDTIVVTIFESAEGGLFLTAGQIGRTGNFVQIPAQTVDSSGTIYVPFAGKIKVTGRTLGQVSADIEGKLQSRAIEPKVVVSIQSREDNRVSVLGEVGAPTQVPININGDRVLDVIAKAGGIKNPGYESYVKLTRGSRTESVYFDALVDNASENIYVRPNDTIYVYKQPQSFVALGAFDESRLVDNRTIEFGAETLNLAEAIGKSGGLNDNKADPRQVLIYRVEERRTLEKMGVDLSTFAPGDQLIPVIYRANLRDPSMMFAAQVFRMRDKDVMFVANAGSVELGKFLKVIGEIGAASLITTGAVRAIDNY
jgi:polysaccharide export outer membrane protein